MFRSAGCIKLSPDKRKQELSKNTSVNCDIFYEIHACIFTDQFS